MCSSAAIGGARARTLAMWIRDWCATPPPPRTQGASTHTATHTVTRRTSALSTVTTLREAKKSSFGKFSACRRPRRLRRRRTASSPMRAVVVGAAYRAPKDRGRGTFALPSMPISRRRAVAATTARVSPFVPLAAPNRAPRSTRRARRLIKRLQSVRRTLAFASAHPLSSADAARTAAVTTAIRFGRVRNAVE